MDWKFEEFPKIARFNKTFIITEKIDGTNASVWVSDDGTEVRAGQRTQFVPEHKDNFGFARWVAEHKDELRKLGPGVHYGEWWGPGIQRGYEVKDTLTKRRFSLFNVSKWAKPEDRPACCDVVPVLSIREGGLQGEIDKALDRLRSEGSLAASGFMKPEGIVIFHTGNSSLFKITFEELEKAARGEVYKGKIAEGV